MADIGAISPVEGLDYNTVTGLNRNPVLRAGRVLGMLGATSRIATELTSSVDAGADATIAAGFQVQEELLTIAAAANSTTTMLIPANSIVLAVLVRVTVSIPTATTFTVGDASGNTGAAARFASVAAVAAGTTAVGILQWSGAVTTLALGPSQAAAVAVRITPGSTPGTNVGRVRIQVVSLSFTAPPA